MKKTYFGLVSLFAFFLATSAFSQTTLFNLAGPQNTGWGESVSAAGDLNGDGTGDLLAGAEDGYGFAAAFSGTNGALLFSFAPQNFTQAYYNLFGEFVFVSSIGTSVDAIGDLDGDGVSESIVGIPNYFNFTPETSVGYAAILPGSAQLSGQAFPIRIHAGELAHEGFGWRVAGLGDVDGDSVSDYAVSSPFKNSPAFLSGAVSVFSGADGHIIHSWTGESAYAYFGFSLASAGDVDGDGVSDVIVGALGAIFHGSYSGSAYVFSGSTGNLIFRRDGDSAEDRFGVSVSAVGDLDNDGRADVVVGTERLSAPGYFRVLSSDEGKTIFTRYAYGAGDFFGYAVSGAGDFNGDGVQDIAASAPLFGGVGNVTIYSGANGNEIATVLGDSANEDFGYSLAGLGDLNADGLADLAIGAPQSSIHGTAVGNVRVIGGVQGPLAHVTDLGVGCQGDASPQISANPPALGSQFTLDLAGFPGDAAVALFLSLVPQISTPPIYVDVGSLLLLSVLPADADGHASLSIQIPADPILLGYHYILQAAVPGSTLICSNGIEVVIGY